MKKSLRDMAILGLSVGLVAGLFAGCGTAESSEEGSVLSLSEAQVESEIAEAEVVVEEEPEPEVLTFTVTATGDCTLGVTQTQSYSGSFNAYYDSYGEDYFFAGVRSIFEADDFTLVNLECVLSTSTDRIEKTYNLKGAPEYVGIMTGSSVEACSLGNNHTYDYGESGYVETKSVLEEAGLTYACLESSGLYVTEEGIAVGIVSSSLLSQSEERLETLKSQIAQLREEGAQIVIACCHWGIEREYYPTDYQVTTAHALIDAGADLIIGNHPHVLQGVEVYEGKVICYSLGNFCFGGNRNPSDKNTMIFQQTFTFVDGELQVDVLDAQIIPCRLSSVDSYNDFQPTIAQGETKANIISLVNTYSSALGSVSFDEDGLLCFE